MTTAHQHAAPQPRGRNGTTTASFHAEFACVEGAQDGERALRANPQIAGVHVDYAGKTVPVAHHSGLIEDEAIGAQISRSAHGCRCTPSAPRATGTGGGLPARAHHADMAAVTMNTAADRMQYEFPSTAAAAQHEAGHAAQAAHGGHAVHAPDQKQARHVTEQHAGHGMQHAGAPAQDEGAHAGHGGMGHDMSDPAMAKAMEADMRNRFFVALLLTIPTVLFSPLATSTFGIEIVGTPWANWIALALSTPAVFWAGWPFIGGAATSLRYRQLNMSVLIATGVLAAWGFSLLITVLGEGETFYEAA